MVYYGELVWRAVLPVSRNGNADGGGAGDAAAENSKQMAGGGSRVHCYGPASQFLGGVLLGVRHGGGREHGAECRLRGAGGQQRGHLSDTDTDGAGSAGGRGGDVLSRAGYCRRFAPPEIPEMGFSRGGFLPFDVGDERDG